MPWPKTPVAVNCAVWPAAMDCVAGDMESETASGLEQPAMDSANAAIRSSTRDEKARSFMVDLWSLQTALVFHVPSWQTLAGLYAFDYRAFKQHTAVTRRCYF